MKNQFAVWGLQHNWLIGSKASSRTTPLLNSPVPLTGAPFGQTIRLTPNANIVAAHLTLAAAKSGLKCIVFVNKLERDLCEGMFRRPDGAQAIVATPTLAQGLNLYSGPGPQFASPFRNPCR
jgi:hypothetical protein